MLFTLVLLAYFIATGFLVEPLLTGLFHFKETWRVGILSIFLNFSFVGFLAGIFVVFYKLNLLVIGLVLVLNILFIIALRRLVKTPVDLVDDYSTTAVELTAPTSAWWLVILYLALTGFGFFLLYHSRSSGSLLTPWQTIDYLYLYIFALATLLLGLLIFSKLSSADKFFLLLVNSVLLHSYLPLTHEFFYGADQWRHVAVEQRIVAERSLEPAALSSPANTLDAQYRLNASGLSISTLAYSSFWGTSALIARVTHIDLITLNRWLVPIFWSLLLPILLLELGETLGWGGRASLFLVWLSFLPFTWQAAGALTLPVSFGFLLWLLLVLLLLKRIEQPGWRQLPVLLVGGLLSFFGYTLYLVLFWLGWALAEVIIKFKTPTGGQSSKRQVFLTILLTTFVALVIPGIELITRYSAFNSSVRWLHQLKELIANFTAWHVAVSPEVGDITAGNIIFNQVPLVSFVSNFFIVWRWWLVVFMLLFLALVGLGLVVCFKKQNKLYQWLASFGSALFLSYVISRYFLVGENIFTRRLDPVLAGFFLLFVVVALRALNFFSAKKWLVTLTIVVLSVATAASYSLGPDTGTVSGDEYAAMQYVWNREKNNIQHCVLADTYPLLALEAISSRDIIGGGFPINQYFAQPELLSFVKSFKEKYDPSLWLRSKAATQANECWLVLPGQLPSVPVQQFGKVAVWRYN